MVYPSAYLEFIRLFNQQQFFEAHEVLELLWKEEKGSPRLFYQGLIQLAAVFVHLEKQNHEGARRLFQTASAYLQPYGTAYLGLNPAAVLAEIQKILVTDGLDFKKTPVLELLA